MTLRIKNLLAPKFLLVIAFAYTVLITYGSLVSSSSFPRFNVPHLDKLVHLIGYGVFVFVWFLYIYFNSVKSKFTSKLLFVGLIALVYGIIVEVLQENLTSTREGDILDIFANFTGILIAIVLIKNFKPKLTKIKKGV